MCGKRGLCGEIGVWEAGFVRGEGFVWEEGIVWDSCGRGLCEKKMNSRTSRESK